MTPPKLPHALCHLGPRVQSPDLWRNQPGPIARLRCGSRKDRTVCWCRSLRSNAFRHSRQRDLTGATPALKISAPDLSCCPSMSVRLARGQHGPVARRPPSKDADSVGDRSRSSLGSDRKGTWAESRSIPCPGLRQGSSPSGWKRRSRFERSRRARPVGRRPTRCVASSETAGADPERTLRRSARGQPGETYAPLRRSPITYTQARYRSNRAPSVNAFPDARPGMVNDLFEGHNASLQSRRQNVLRGAGEKP